MSSIPVPVLLIVAAFVVCVAALRLVGGTARRGTGFRAADYRAKRLLSPWEAKVLVEIKLDLPVGYHACPQVRLADFLDIAEREPARRRAALNRVASKSVDFVIIDGVGRVVLVIELDDRSHARADRRQRDQLVEAVLDRCGVPLVRVGPGRRVGVGPYLAGVRSRAAA